MFAKSSLIYLCVSLHHVGSNSLQPLLVESQVGGGCEQLTECVFLPPFHLDFWTLHNLVLHYLFFSLSRISLRFYKDSSDGTHLEGL